MEGCLRTARQKDAVDVGEVTVDVEGSKKVSGNASEVCTQTKKQAVPISPSGLPLEQEAQSRRQLLEQKQKSLEEYTSQARRQHAHSVAVGPTSPQPGHSGGPYFSIQPGVSDSPRRPGAALYRTSKKPSQLLSPLQD